MRFLRFFAANCFFRFIHGDSMSIIRITSVVFLVIMASALSGCSAKKEKAEQQQPLQQKMSSSAKAAVKPGDVPPHPVITASPQDEADAAILKKQVLDRIKNGDFSAIYKEASAGFREVGPEGQFVGLWELQLKQTGAFKEAKEIRHAVRPQDKFLVYVYQLQYEKAKKELFLTFGRSKSGKMELTGINQKEVNSN